jgi:DNA-binding MarR family transcriptional regulator
VLAGDELTAAGRQALAGLTEKVVALRQRVTAGIGVDEYAVTVDVLRRMAHNLQAPKSSAV